MLGLFYFFAGKLFIVVSVIPWMMTLDLIEFYANVFDACSMRSVSLISAVTNAKAGAGGVL